MKKLGLLLALVVIAGMSSAQTIIFSDNFSTFPGSWTNSGFIQTSARVYSASFAVRGASGNPYANNLNNTLTRAVNLSSYSSATLTFWCWQYTESGYDSIVVEYYSGTSWTRAWSRSGNFQSWTQHTVTIPTTATQIRFRFKSDGSVAYEGAYIDDVVLTGTASTVTQNDAGSGGDAGNTITTATLVSSGSWTGCYLDATDREDYYRFNVNSGQVIKVKITPPTSADFDLYLYNPSQAQVASSTRAAGLVDSVVFTANATGTWYARAYQYSGAGYYSLQISVSGGTAPNLAVSATSWSAPAAGGTSSAINVTNSTTSDVISYTVSSNQSWLTVSSSSGTTPGSFTMTAAANTGAARSATVTITATAPSGTTGSPKTITVNQEAASASTAEWTIMVYLNADNDLEQYGIDDFIEMANASYSSGKVNLIVQMDRASGYDSRYDNWTTCKRFIMRNGITPVAANQISDLGEVDMGNPQTLADFAKWAITNYPANRYSLILWDHGDGWYKGDEDPPIFRGFSNDNSHGSVIDISNGELANALSQIKSHLGRNLDHIGWDACLMGMWEVLDIAKNYANVANVSEEVEGAAGWWYTTWLNNLNTTPTMNAIDLGKAIINSTSGQPTLSVVDLTQIASLNTAVNTLATELMAARGAGLGAAISTALNNTLKFSPSYFSFHIDLADFCTKIKAQITTRPSLTTACDNVISGVSNAVKLYKNSSTYANARGIAIYHCKIDGSNYDTRYNNLPVASATQWDEYIKGGSTGGSTANYTQSIVPYSWDASATTATGCTGDDQAVTIALPFTFNFYGTNYTSINICSNGFLNFGTTSTAYTPAAIPNAAAPNAMIAGLWRDLNPSGGGTITYFSSPTKFVVSYNAVKNYANTNTQTFQIILTPDGAIRIQWGSITTSESYSSGVENASGSVGVSVTAAANRAVLFTPPASWNTISQDPNAQNLRFNTPEVPVVSMLSPNAPNPVRNKTFISYQLAQPGHTSLKIYNTNGQLVRTLVDAPQPAGYYDISWDAKDDRGNRVAAGVYLYQIISGSFNQSRKMVVMK